MKRILTLLFILVTNFSQSQTTRFWSGNSPSSDNIDQSTNWFGNINPLSGDHLSFDNSISSRKFPFCNYGAGAFFGNIIVYNNSGGIRWRGNKTFAFKFENFNDPNTFEFDDG